jgi:hypothetical protein
VSAFPAWTGAAGEPLSWRHYLAGRRHLAQARARQSAQLAGAFAIAQPGVKEENHRAWWNDITTQAGWS